MPIRVRPHKQNMFSFIEELYVPTRHYKSVPREAYPSLGFGYNLSFEEAVERAKQVNKLARKDTKTRAAAARRVAEEELANELYLPKAWLNEFEDEVIPEQALGNPERQDVLRKRWSTCKKIIAALELEPKDFESRKRAFYSEFLKREFSRNYVGSLVRLINLWGAFHSSKTNSFFKPLPQSKSDVVQRIVERNEDKEGARRPDTPLSWDLLKNKKSSFEIAKQTDQWNWLAVALWFALRPREADNLVRHPESWKVRRNEANGLDELLVFQTKLTGVKREDRWKVVPLYFEEQRELLNVIRSGRLKRPILKTMRSLLKGKGYGTYSPRKGATDHFLARGFTLEDAAVFLGHKSANTTWAHYHYKNKLQYTLPKKVS